MTDREIMQQALEALMDANKFEYKDEIAALRQALAQPEHQFKYTPYGLRADENGTLSIGEIPQRGWVGLTDEEIHECNKLGLRDDVYKAIEQKLKDLNT